MLRVPWGGYFDQFTACRASSRVPTIGTSTPHAPASNVHLNHSKLLEGIRTKGALVPASAIIAIISATSIGCCALCSASISSQSKPSRAISRATRTSGRLIQAPMLGSPLLSFAFTWFVRNLQPLFHALSENLAFPSTLYDN